MKELHMPSWIRKTLPIFLADLPIPLLKVSINSYEFLNSFGLENMDKIDLTVGNVTAAINS